MLKEYDIVTFSFGDSYRHYMRGQLTVYKNKPHINTLWRNCTALTNFGARLMRLRNHYAKHKEVSLWSWGFQSAEGCISKVVTDTKSISFYVSASQFSDAYKATLRDRESFSLGWSLNRCFLQPFLYKDLVLRSTSRDKPGSVDGIPRQEYSKVLTEYRDFMYGAVR